MDPFDWEEFLELAEELVGPRGDAGAARTAISRAYDAAFHRAREHGSRLGMRLTRTGEDQVLVWDWFLRSGTANPLGRIGADGRWLRRARRGADYDAVSYPQLSREAQTAVDLARRILADLDRLRSLR